MKLNFTPPITNRYSLTGWEASPQIGLLVADGIMEQRSHYGTVKSVTLPTFHPLENIINHGKIPHLWMLVLNVNLLPGLLGKPVHLILGWIARLAVLLQSHTLKILNSLSKLFLVPYVLKERILLELGLITPS
jgi:hypothetical protein